MDGETRQEPNPPDISLMLESEVLFGLPGFEQVARESQYIGFKGLEDIMDAVGQMMEGKIEPGRIRKAPPRALMLRNDDQGWRQFTAGWVLKDLQDMGRDDLVMQVEDGATRLGALIDSTGGSVGVDVSASRELSESTAGRLPEVMQEMGVQVGQLPDPSTLEKIMGESARRVWQNSAFSANAHVGTNLTEYAKTLSGLMGSLQTFGQVLMQGQSSLGRKF